MEETILPELDSKFSQTVDALSDEDIHHLFSAYSSWSSSTRRNDERTTDEDGFSTMGLMTRKLTVDNFAQVQQMCWNMFVENPQISSHVRDVTGNLTGFGFDVNCDIREINDVVREIMTDPRNDLYQKIPKFVARSEVEGELFLSLSLHKNGFVEVDFMDPSTCKGGTGDWGIYYHPTKRTFPMFYSFSVKDIKGGEETIVIPGINAAYYPDLAKEAIKFYSITPSLLKLSSDSSSKYKELGGFKRFIVSWDKGYFTPRNVSHIRTTIEWINHYVNLKQWEIDHKRSSGAYLWVVSLTDVKALRTWLKMTDDEKKGTGIMSKKTPGGTLVLPPGVKIECINPSLASISEQDTDIMHMVTSGLNKPEDMVTGQTRGDTFSGVKASRGPQADRVQDQIAAFERFLRFDMWRGILFVRSKVTDFAFEYKVRETVKFRKREPKVRKVTKKCWELLTFDFPSSEISDLESKARALLGVKHPSVIECLGIPRADVAKKLGFGSYKKSRLMYSTEEEEFPELPTMAELEMAQSSMQEPQNPNNKNNQNSNNPQNPNDPNAPQNPNDPKNKKKLAPTGTPIDKSKKEGVKKKKAGVSNNK